MLQQQTDPFLPDNPFEVGDLQKSLAPEEEKDDSQLGPEESPLEPGAVSGEQPSDAEQPPVAEPTGSQHREPWEPTMGSLSDPFTTVPFGIEKKHPIIDRQEAFRLEERQKMDNRYKGGLSTEWEAFNKETEGIKRGDRYNPAWGGLFDDSPGAELSPLLEAFTPSPSEQVALTEMGAQAEHFGHNESLPTTQETFPRSLFEHSQIGYGLLNNETPNAENLNYAYDEWVFPLEGSSENVMVDLHSDENKGLVIGAGLNIDKLVDDSLEQAHDNATDRLTYVQGQIDVLAVNDNLTQEQVHQMEEYSEEQAALTSEVSTLDAVRNSNATGKKNFLNNEMSVELNAQTQKAISANELNTRIGRYFGTDERWDVTDRQDIKVLKGLMTSQIWNIIGGAEGFSGRAPKAHAAARDLAGLIQENTLNDAQNARIDELELQEEQAEENPDNDEYPPLNGAEQTELDNLVGLRATAQELAAIDNKRTELAVQLASGSDGITNLGSVVRETSETVAGVTIKIPSDILVSRRLGEINKFLSGNNARPDTFDSTIRSRLNGLITNQVSAINTQTLDATIGSTNGLNSKLNRMAYYLRQSNEDGVELPDNASNADKLAAKLRAQAFVDKAVTIIVNRRGLKDGEVYVRNENRQPGESSGHWVAGDSASYYAPPPAPEPEPEPAVAETGDGELYQLPASSTA